MARLSLPASIAPHVSTILSMTLDANGNPLPPENGKAHSKGVFGFEVFDPNTRGVPPRLQLNKNCFDKATGDVQLRTAAQLRLMGFAAQYLIEKGISGDDMSIRTYYVDKSGANIIALQISLQACVTGGTSAAAPAPAKSIEQQISDGIQALMGQNRFDAVQYSTYKAMGLEVALAWVNTQLNGAGSTGTATSTPSKPETAGAEAVPDAGAGGGRKVEEENPLG